ncbi:MAG: hypothetical protein IMZ64_04055 [Bacteroidetes bacterium]|nr:hypothetical protein [Bacteroidota bacterium]
MAFEKEQINDAVQYVLNNSSVTDPDSISTIIYTADLYHLILFGRTIINSIRNFKYYFIEKEDLIKVIKENKKSDYKYLSETDEEALKFALLREELCNDGGLFPIPKCFGKV